MPDWRDDCRDARMANEAAGSSESESSALFFRWWFRPPRLDDGCGSANGGRERAAGERGERLELELTALRDPESLERGEQVALDKLLRYSREKRLFQKGREDPSPAGRAPPRWGS